MGEDFVEILSRRCGGNIGHTLPLSHGRRVFNRCPFICLFYKMVSLGDSTIYGCTEPMRNCLLWLLVKGTQHTLTVPVVDMGNERSTYIYLYVYLTRNHPLIELPCGLQILSPRISASNAISRPGELVINPILHYGSNRKRSEKRDEWSPVSRHRVQPGCEEYLADHKQDRQP